MVSRTSAWALAMMMGCAAAAAVGAPPGSTAAAPASATGFVDLSDVDAALIVATARSAFKAACNRQARPPIVYRPSSMQGFRARVTVTLRWQGRVVSQAESPESDPLDGASLAATTAAESAPKDWLLSDKIVGTCIEVELSGPPEFVVAGLDADLKAEPGLYESFEPGVDGIGVQCAQREGRCRPSVVLAQGYTPDLAIQHAIKDAGQTERLLLKNRGAVRFFRFPTMHIWQANGLARPVRLRRGVVPIPMRDVTAQKLDAAIELGLAHVLARRRRDAWFAYEFVPHSGAYSEANSLFGQFQAAYGLGMFGKLAHRDTCVASAARVVAAAQSFVQPFQNDLPARAITATKDVPPLAATAMYLSCLSRFPSAETKLEGTPIADALRVVQHEDGRFELVFPPQQPMEGKPFAGAVALLALLDHAGNRPDENVDRSVRQGVRFYRNYFAHKPDRRFAAWLGPALAAAYQRRPDPEASDFLFAVGDWLVLRQASPREGLSVELIGGITDNAASADAETAHSLVALCDALAMARRLGDAARVERYTSAVRLAARFVLQLQVHDEECFYLNRPDDVRGAFRASLWNQLLRIDDSAMAVYALARARSELFGPQAGPAAASRPK